MQKIMIAVRSEAGTKPGKAPKQTLRFDPIIDRNEPAAHDLDIKQAKPENVLDGEPVNDWIKALEDKATGRQPPQQ